MFEIHAYIWGVHVYIWGVHVVHLGCSCLARFYDPPAGLCATLLPNVYDRAPSPPPPVMKPAMRRPVPPPSDQGTGTTRTQPPRNPDPPSSPLHRRHLTEASTHAQSISSFSSVRGHGCACVRTVMGPCGGGVVSGSGLRRPRPQEPSQSVRVLFMK